MEPSLLYWYYLTQYTIFLSGLVQTVLGGENVGKILSMKNR